jgi:hypothetical protein
VPADKPDLAQTWTDDLATPRPANDRPPSDRYELRRELGRGGMGRVVLAWDLVLQREVAVKLLVAGRGREVFLREARIAARLEHPAIVPVHDAGVTEHGEAFYVMRLVPGTHLGEAVGRTAPAARLGLLDAVIDVARALAYAHELGVVHRDLKAENVMLGPWGEVQVVDWGLARVLQEADPGLRALAEDPEAGRVVGTPAYMSPEQASGLPADARADVWALGMVLREVLTGERPWERTTAPELVMAAVREGRVPVLPPEVPPELAAVVRRATAPAPGDRYAHAGAFVEDLLAFRAGRRVSAHTYSAREEWRRFDRRFWWPVRAAAAGVLAGTVALGVVTSQYRAARRAEAAERQANVDLSQAHGHLGQALTRSLLQSARDADRELRGTEALTWAAAALERDPSDPVARGIIGRWLGSLPVTVAVDHGEVPGPCHRLLPGSRGDLVCSGPAGTWSWDGEVRWHRPELTGWALARNDAVAVLPDGKGALVVDTATGTTRTHLPETRVATLVGDDLYRAFLTRVERWSLGGERLAGLDLASQVVGMKSTADEVVAWTASGVLYRFDRDLTLRGSTAVQPRRALSAVLFSSGDLAIGSHPDQGASLLSTSAATLRPVEELDGLVTGVGIAPGADRAFVSSDLGFWLVDPQRATPTAVFPSGGSTDLLLGSDDTLRLVAGTHLQTLAVTATPTQYPQVGGVRDLRPLGEGRVLITTSGGAAQVLDVNDGSVVDSALVPGTINAPSVVWKGPGRWIAATGKGVVEGDGRTWRGDGGAGVWGLVPWQSGYAALGHGYVSFVAGDGAELRVAVPEHLKDLSRDGDEVLATDLRGAFWRVSPEGIAATSAAPFEGASLVGFEACGGWWARGVTLQRVGQAVVPTPTLPQDDRIRGACTVGPDAVAVSMSQTVRILRISTGEELAHIGPFPARIAALAVVDDWLLMGRWSGGVDRWWVPALELPAGVLGASARQQTGWTAADGVLAPAPLE